MRKRISNISQHPPVGQIENGIRDRILHIIRNTDWLHIYVQRIGYARKVHYNASVVLISVAPGTILEEDAEVAVTQCHQYSYRQDITWLE
jgi:hypothetical protein